VPPDQDVGVGAQAGQVVDAAGHRVVGGELVEEVGDLRGLGGPVGVTEDVAQPEDRPQGVPDRGVDLACLGDLVDHALILPR
jgi:hypothetical protein